MGYKKKDIVNGFNTIKKLGIRAARNKNHSKALYYFDQAAILAYNLNWIFKDQEIENCLNNIAKQLLPNVCERYNPNKNRFVFYDQIGSTTVLALQYLRALISWNIEFLYILDPSRYSSNEIIDEISKYSKAEVYVLPELLEDKVLNVRLIYDKIILYSPEITFLHSPADGSFGVMLWSLLPQIKRYRIVPGDHHFYLGISVTDYAIEFREFGLSLSFYKRDLHSEQLILQPYYPIENNAKFEGLPSFEIEKPIIIYTGGATYKIMGEDNLFFEIMKKILLNYENVIILFSGSEYNLYIDDFIKQNKFEKRFYFLGFRKDFIEIMKKCDIYLGTYPFFGGLMTQYAAICKKPILQYLPEKQISYLLDGIESVLAYGQHAEKRISFDKLKDFFEYADKLIIDDFFRVREGEILSTRVINKAEFEEVLYAQIFVQRNDINIKQINENYFYEKEKWYLDVANNYSNFYSKFFVDIFGVKKLSMFNYVFILRKRQIKRFIISLLKH